MSTTIEHIKTLLDEEGLKYKVLDEDKIDMGFNMDCGSYLNKKGTSRLTIGLRLSENGDFLQFFSPFCYEIEDCKHKSSLYELLLIISNRYKLIRWELYKNMIIPSVELTLENSELSLLQLRRCIGAILGVVNQYNDAIVRAIKTGVVSFENEGLKAFGEFVEREGIENIRKALGGE